MIGIEAYGRLRLLRGRVIPLLYGEIVCHQGNASRQTFILSDVGNISLDREGAFSIQKVIPGA